MTKGNVVAKGGLDGVAVADSAICKIDGEVGELRYRGYLIKDLAEHSDFVETAHLLWHGDLPTRAAKERLTAELAAHRELPPLVVDVLRRIAKHQPPMDALRTVVSVLSIDDVAGPVDDRAANVARAVRLTARVATAVAAHDRLRHGETPIPSDPTLDHASNFLYMLTGRRPDAEVARMLDTCLVLHAEHGFNASTFAGRVTAATLSDIYSAVVSAVGTLKGPLHGGANTEVMQALLSIGSVDGVQPWLERKLAKHEKVMGFGHRVYKVVDPRALILRGFAERIAEISGERKWFDMSCQLEQLVKTRKGIDMNVDFYSASTYYGMGIRPDLFTPVFAVSRVVGWTAHVIEQHANNRLIRPQSNWVGVQDRTWVGFDAR